MKVRIKVQPTGCINGQVWPKVGEIVDLPKAVAADMQRVGNVEPVADEPKVPEVKPEPKKETRPAPVKAVEKRDSE